MEGQAAAASDQPEAPQEEASDWSPVVFPGQIPLAESYGSAAPPLATEPGIESTVLPPSNSQEAAANTNELVQLIQDLNHCNDALLNRVSDLEEALERSQAALQAEIERNQGVAAMANGSVPHQVAQLLSELDIANDGLRRTTMHNEALQAELDVSQQRVAQLERECTLLQQRFSEKSTALQQAEHTCRDLKSRLHRQQRYTLQFKAALEKCLNMPASQSPMGGSFSPVPREVHDDLPQPVAMPRSQQIQPWSAASEGSQDEDVSLTDLLRGLKSAGHGLRVSAPSFDSQRPAPAASQPAKAADPEAEALLWQDLERVTEPQVPPESQFLLPKQPDLWHDPVQADAQPPADAPSVSISDPGVDDLAFTEPSPWGAPLPTRAADPVELPAPDIEDLPPLPAQEPEPQVLSTPASVPPEVTPARANRPPVVSAGAPPARASMPPAALPDYLTGATAAPTSSPSPLVYPLRSQKKRTSLASVELPSFGRTPRRRQA